MRLGIQQPHRPLETPITPNWVLIHLSSQLRDGFGDLRGILQLTWTIVSDSTSQTARGLTNRCVVVEDAPVGIAAARAAGMKCIGIASTGRTPDELRAADLGVGSLRGVGADDVRRLLRST